MLIKIKAIILPYDTTVVERTYFPRALKTAFIYTMRQSEGTYNERLKSMEDFISMIFRTPINTFYSYLNYPFLDDYRNYEASDLSSMMKRREEVFPVELEKAFDFGKKL